MARQLSEAVRERILGAAEEEFAAAGYSGATMAAIAKRAAISTGNIYRYYQDKDDLFYTLFSDAFAEEFMQLLQARVQGLIEADSLTALSPQARRQGEALLGFWAANRLKVITLLDRAHGSRHEDFGERFVEALLRPTIKQLSGKWRMDTVSHQVLAIIFRNTRSAIVAMLESCHDEAWLRRAFEAFWRYQLAGLAGFAKGGET